ncbi:MAG: leucine--tRNA ligase [Candidatus Pacebacteria bacterium]|nr:leucine--tRNA ligase [Candidatus Paceibacterota bacterium]
MPKKQKEYDHLKIESKWQKDWEKKKLYNAKDNDQEKSFILVEFPFPSGAGLHTGHIRSYTALDIVARKRRMEGKNVLYPMGWDAFGLPTEQYAIKTGVQPKIVTKKNTDMFRKQLKAVGLSFDWSREVNTTDPEYYKWTQWIFLQFFKEGLAYKKKTTINWCPKDKIGLANEEVVDGACERCGTPTEKKEKDQWMMAITKYAERLDKDLDDVDYPERVKIQQRNWIGKSEGSEINFKLQTSNNIQESVTVFTTRADTIFGATYVVLAPEHSLIESLLSTVVNKSEVQKYIVEAKKKDDIARTAEDKEKTGVELEGIKAINPANDELISVWVGDYVLPHYGTGAIMAVPEHDARDRAFAEKYNLPIIDKPLVDAGQITKKLGGKIVTKFKLRDWVFSRQRYWGEPIPIIHCEKCGYVAVPEKDLPVVLPPVKSYVPTDNGESPLAIITKWVNTKCPTCKGPAKRETDTMPNWAGSSWYYLRYADSKNKKSFADAKKLKYWTPVDWYNGGMEHTTLHLLYSRFWHKFLYDMKLVPTHEPYAKRTSHGLILAEGGIKMSKSLGNVVNPDDIVKTYGADTLRMYQMFMGPFEQAVVWNSDGIIGPRRFIERVWKLASKIKEPARTESVRSGGQKENSKENTYEIILNQTIKKVGEDIESMGFNTAVSGMMMCLNELEKSEVVLIEDFKKFIQILAPFAPHVAEEIWHEFGEKNSVHISPWPKYDETKLVSDTVKIMIQVNGKIRSDITVARNESEEAVKKIALLDDRVQKALAGQVPKKIIYVQGRILNIVV